MQELRQTPYWWDTVAMPSATSPSLPEAVDVAVIGSGITGLSAALTLARRGVRVAVLEARSIGWGASSRNGGMVLTGLKLGTTTLIRRYGHALARELYAMSLEAVDCVERLTLDEHIDCDFNRRGHLALASKSAHVRQFERSADVLARDFGHSVRVAAAAELRDEIGSERYYGGLIDEKSAGLNPARYVAGLARSAQAAGVTLHDHAPVERIARHELRWQVSTGRGVLLATDVLVATSGYTGCVTPALRRRIVPVGSYVIATEPLSEGVAHSVSPRGRMMYDSRHFLHYFRLTPDRRLLFGGRARFVPETTSTVRESAAILGREMRQVFPQLAGARVEYAWGGTLDFAFDTMPHAGTLDGWHYSLGYAGHGVALATLLGTRIAQSMVDADVPALPFSQIAFPALPRIVYSGRPWFLPIAAAWYRFLDLIG